jgi:hypothetical protein
MKISLSHVFFCVAPLDEGCTFISRQEEAGMVRI